MRSIVRSTNSGRVTAARLLLLFPLVLVVAILSGSAPAFAASPAFQVNTIDNPTSLPPGGEGKVRLEVYNLGAVPTNGSPIVVSDVLPTGLTVKEAPGCEIAATSQSFRCENQSTLTPYARFDVEITVAVAEDAPAKAVNLVSVGGGGAPGLVTREPLTVSATPASFGVESLKVVPTNEDGSIDTQAGSHPFQLTTTLELSTSLLKAGLSSTLTPNPTAFARDLRFDLPAGLFGNPTVMPQCTNDEFAAVLLNDANSCPAATAIGVASVTLFQAGSVFTVPLFNLVPSAGEPARFGFRVLGVPVYLDTAVRTGGDYGVVVNVDHISQLAQFFASQLTIWGVPNSQAHNSARGWGCLNGSGAEGCVNAPSVKPEPLLTLPTACGGSAGMRTTVEADSWAEPGVFKDDEALLQSDAGEPVGLTGCNQLPFEPQIRTVPDTPTASSASGLTTDVHIPQSASLNGEGLAESSVRDITVALPEGVAINPAGADGLEACSEAQIGFTGKEPGEPAQNLFTPTVGRNRSVRTRRRSGP